MILSKTKFCFTSEQGRMETMADEILITFSITEFRVFINQSSGQFSLDHFIKYLAKLIIFTPLCLLLDRNKKSSLLLLIFQSLYYEMKENIKTLFSISYISYYEMNIEKIISVFDSIYIYEFLNSAGYITVFLILQENGIILV